MEPNVAQGLANVPADPAVTAGLVALAIGLMEVIKQIVSWTTRKITGADSTSLHVQLDPDVSKIMHETASSVKDVNSVIMRTGTNGVPLVYADRRTEANISQIVLLMNEISQGQLRLADAMSKLGGKLEEHDRTANIAFVRIEDAHRRSDAAILANHDDLFSLKKDIAQLIEKVDELIREWHEKG